MCKHTLGTLILLAIAGTLLPTIVFGAFGSFDSKSFGGKILTPTIPGVMCIPTITGPVVLKSNIGGAIASAAGTGYVASLPTHTGKNTDGSTISKGGKAALITAGAISTVYSLVPYAVFSQLNPQKPTPVPGTWILGKSTRIPNFSDCWIPTPSGNIPFPVLEVGIPPPGLYNISKTPSF